MEKIGRILFDAMDKHRKTFPVATRYRIKEGTIPRYLMRIIQTPEVARAVHEASMQYEAYRQPTTEEQQAA